MKAYFYVIKWWDGSGISSGLTFAESAVEAFSKIKEENDYGLEGDILTFNFVEVVQ